MKVPARIDPETQVYLRVLESRIRALEDLVGVGTRDPVPDPIPRVMAAPYAFDSDITITNSAAGICMWNAATATYFRTTISGGAVTTSDTLSATIPDSA